MATNGTREYELVFVLQPEVTDAEITTLNERLAHAISGTGGELSLTELWGKRQLAYPIKNFFEGHYILHRFQMEPQATGEIDRVLRYQEDVLRYLLVRTDEA